MEPPYERTEDGFELTLATNHLGHFALTGLVLDRLLATPGSRVVTMSSQGHWEGVMNFDDLQSEHGYRRDRPTSSPSWPTCCSPTSWTGACARPGRR